MQKPNLKLVDIFVGKQGLLKLEPQWLALAKKSGTHFLHFPGWYRAELHNRAEDRNVCFAALYDQQSTLFAVLPFERSYLSKGRVKLPVLQLFYPNEMGVNDVLAALPLSGYRAAIIRQMKKSLPYFAFVRWQCALADGAAVSILDDPATIRITHHSKYLDFSSGLDSFWAGYSSKFRKGLQKKMRKAEEQGSLRLDCVTQVDALQPAFEQFLQVEDSGWKGQRGTSIVKQPAKLAYYQSLLQSYGELGQCQINLLYLDNTVIAAQFGVQVNGRLYLLKIGFREDFAAISPGYLILGKLIEYGCQTGQLGSVSFVTGVDWINRWHPKTQPVGIFYTHNGTLYSSLLVKGLVAAVKFKNRRAAVTAAAVQVDDE